MFIFHVYIYSVYTLTLKLVKCINALRLREPHMIDTVIRLPLNSLLMNTLSRVATNWIQPTPNKEGKMAIGGVKVWRGLRAWRKEAPAVGNPAEVGFETWYRLKGWRACREQSQDSIWTGRQG